MMGWTDRHARYFLRLITKHTLLYTEMVTTAALKHGNTAQFLAHHENENPLALQLGGSDPAELADCARLAEDAGYDEVNINVGCPSDRVRSGRFGACLMACPELVADCVAAMRARVAIPVTVKCRIGIDNMESYEAFENFITVVAGAGCDTFIVHARKAWLQGLSPKQNREIPPLKYDYVYRLKAEQPRLTVVINGGIKTIADARRHLQQVDGVMIGREAYHNPWILADVDRTIFGDASGPDLSRSQIVLQMCEYIDAEVVQGVPLHAITRHILGLYQGCPGARAWRRYLSENSHADDADSTVVTAAMHEVERLLNNPKYNIASSATG